MAKKRTFNESFSGSETDDISTTKRRKLHESIETDTNSIPTSVSQSLEEKQSNCDKIVNLQVGEKKYVTRISTLIQHSAYFASLFSGRFPSTETYHGSYFIDRDGDIFYYILSYLRSGTLVLSSSESDLLLKKLLIEAKYYMIQPLVDYIQTQTKSPNVGSGNSQFSDSKILSASEMASLESLFDEDDTQRIWELKLEENLFISKKALTKVVHDPSKRQWPNPSIVVVEDLHGNVFGIKSRIGICPFEILFANGYNKYSELVDKQEAIYFNIRDVEKKILPLTVFAECNQVMTNFVSSEMRISMKRRPCFLGCYTTPNKKIGDTTDGERVLCVLIPQDLKSVGERLTSVPGKSDVHSKFIVARIEVFVKSKRKRR